MPSTNPNTESKKGNVGPLSKKGTFMSKHCLSKYGEAKDRAYQHGASNEKIWRPCNKYESPYDQKRV